MNGVKLIVITPRGEAANVECESATVFCRDGINGENGGSIGIMRGFLPSLIALKEGSPVRAMSGGKPVFEARVKGGFASVKDDIVTVMTEALTD